MVVMNRQQTCRGSFIDRKNANFLARINNFTDSGEGYIAADIVPDRIFPTPHGRAVLASAAVVRLSGVPIGVAHGLSRPLPNIGAFLGIVSCPKPNVMLGKKTLRAKMLIKE